MSKKVSRAMEYGGFGGSIGLALGTLFAGATLAIPGVNIVVAPLVAAAAATTVAVSGTAVGTLAGSTVGFISGAKEEQKEKKQQRKVR